MTSLRMAFHQVTGRRVVEIADDRGNVVGVIYPTMDGSNAIHIVSNYFAPDALAASPPGILKTPGYLMKFKSP